VTVETRAGETIRDLNRYAAEAIGTFALVFAGTGAVVVDHVHAGAVTHVGVAMTFGLIVTAMIYAVGETSGAHLNPAVTLGFFVAGRFPARRVMPYIASQAVGAFAASALLRLMFGTRGALGATVPAGGAAQSFLMEVVLTALLMFVILCVATGSKEQGLMAGIAIGATVGLEAMFAGPVSGASMNPARSLAPAVVGLDLRYSWIYLLAPPTGAVVAVACWNAVRTHADRIPSR
jgi:MIP family channel proteins